MSSVLKSIGENMSYLAYQLKCSKLFLLPLENITMTCINIIKDVWGKHAIQISFTLAAKPKWEFNFKTHRASFYPIGGRRAFSEFLRCEYSEENILFWQACEDFKKETNPNVIEEKARLIYEDFISILSPREVRAACVHVLAQGCVKIILLVWMHRFFLHLDTIGILCLVYS